MVPFFGFFTADNNVVTDTDCIIVSPNNICGGDKNDD
jgi:hypothetical protein